MNSQRAKPRLLDLFCGAGGAAMGYAQAGFEVVGVDLVHQPHYPFEFHQADALEWPLEGFDAIHASPPCQRYANVTAWRGDPASHPDLLTPTRARLQAFATVPWIIENVPEAPLRADYLLCGSILGLRVKRHRAFETSWGGGFNLLAPHNHNGLLPFMHKNERVFADAMGCMWMTKEEAREAIPPVYTWFIGKQLLVHLEAPHMTIESIPPPRYSEDEPCPHGQDKARCPRCEDWRNRYASGFDAAH